MISDSLYWLSRRKRERLMNYYFEALIISLVIALVTTIMFYEILGVVMKIITRRTMTPRKLLLVLISGILLAHSITIILYSMVYWILVQLEHCPPLQGIDAGEIGAYLYYSATSYSSLGVGDIYAKGSLRLITSFEVINGLTLIAWSATFTYFAVQKMWESMGMPLQVKCKCPSSKDDQLVIK